MNLSISQMESTMVFYLKYFSCRNFPTHLYTEFVVRECASKKMKKVFILFTKCWKGEKSLFGAEIFVRPNKPETFKIIWVIKN